MWQWRWERVTSARSAMASLSAREETLTRRTMSLSNLPKLRSSSNPRPAVPVPPPHRLPRRPVRKSDLTIALASASQCVHAHDRKGGRSPCEGARAFRHGGVCGCGGGRTKPAWLCGRFPAAARTAGSGRAEVRGAQRTRRDSRGRRRAWTAKSILGGLVMCKQQLAVGLDPRSSRRDSNPDQPSCHNCGLDPRHVAIPIQTSPFALRRNSQSGLESSSPPATLRM